MTPAIRELTLLLAKLAVEDYLCEVEHESDRNDFAQASEIQDGHARLLNQPPDSNAENGR